MSARKALLAISARWPRDHLRPRRQFADAIEKTANELYPTTSGPKIVAGSVAGAKPAGGNSKKPNSNLHLSGEVNGVKEKQMLDSLDRLLKSSAYMKYPMPKRLFHPVSYPGYFERLQRNFEETKIDAYENNSTHDIQDTKTTFWNRLLYVIKERRWF